jgi:hypothetical protein
LPIEKVAAGSVERTSTEAEILSTTSVIGEDAAALLKIT